MVNSSWFPLTVVPLWTTEVIKPPGALSPPSSVGSSVKGTDRDSSGERNGGGTPSHSGAWLTLNIVLVSGV